MKHRVRILWGTVATRAETDTTQDYEFDTLEELNAFLKGISECHGWVDYEQVDPVQGDCGHWDFEDDLFKMADGRQQCKQCADKSVEEAV